MDAICRNCGAHSINGILEHTPECGKAREMAGMVGLGETTYSMDCTCSNCTFQGSVSIKKGTPLSQRACPSCGCATLNGSRYWL